MTLALWHATMTLDAVGSYRYPSRAGSMCENTVHRVGPMVSRPPSV